MLKADEPPKPQPAIQQPEQQPAAKPAAKPTVQPQAPKPEEPTPQQSSIVSVEDLRSFIAPWEGGYRSKAYQDSKGIWTIGVGYNLEQNSADTELKALGVNKQDLISGKKSLNQQQMDVLFDKSIKRAVADAHKWIPNLNTLPKEVQLICIDMAFNMGGGTIMTFTNTGKAIQSKQFDKAADLMEKSRWYGQVGNRSKHHVEVMRKLVGKAPSQPTNQPSPTPKKQQDHKKVKK
jgi:lysozyme